MSRPRDLALLLLAATILPGVSLVTGHEPSWKIILALSIAHGGWGTWYLLSDPSLRRVLRASAWKLVAPPVLLILASAWTFSAVERPFRREALFTLLLALAWHFGKQGVGVCSFTSVIDRGRPLSPGERRVLLVVSAAGTLGILRTLHPVYSDQSPPVVEGSLLSAIEWAWHAGRIAALGALPFVLAFALGAARRGHVLFAIQFLLSGCFWLPCLLSLGEASKGWLYAGQAHGLQYCAFLLAHASRELKVPSRDLRWAPAAGMFAFLLVGAWLWQRADMIGIEGAPLLGHGVLFGLTFAHFWVDAFIWRGSGDHAAWVRERFGWLKDTSA